MNKMREAFEKWYGEPWNANSAMYEQDVFEAGYQAAIADVKAGGAVWTVHEKGTLGVEIPLYKLPEDV